MLHAIFKTPWDRRQQTLAVAVWFYLPILSILAFVGLVYFGFWALLSLYLVWFLISFRAPFNGKPFAFLAKIFRMLFPSLFTHFSPYFPVVIHFDEECSIDKDQQYMFGYHPHGIFGLGAVATFALAKPPILSQLRLRLLTVDLNFCIPLWRDFLMALGLSGVGRESVRSLLRTGHSVAIVIGGAREALDAAPGISDLVLRKRKGFFREALKHGCSVVPVFGFGENELYEVVSAGDNSGWMRRVQDRLIHWFGFTLPLFNGRGMFNYERGVLPRRHPIHVVIGRPIDPASPPIESPTLDDINRLQERYIVELKRIYDKHKDDYLGRRRRSLTIIQ